MSQYRRTPPPQRRPPAQRLPQGRRLVIILVALGLLAVLAVTAVITSRDSGEAATTTTATTEIRGTVSDSTVAAQLLPATLGQGWAEVSREAEPVPAEVASDDPCAAAGQPIQSGVVVRASFDHLGTSTIVEQVSIVAGVVEEGTDVPSLSDPAVVDCLQAGLAPQVPEGNELVPAAADVEAPDGAELSAARFEVRGADGTVGARFDLLLLQRDRAVVFALVVVEDPASATPIDEIVAALDAPLAAAAPHLS